MQKEKELSLLKCKLEQTSKYCTLDNINYLELLHTKNNYIKLITDLEK